MIVLESNHGVLTTKDYNYVVDKCNDKNNHAILLLKTKADYEKIIEMMDFYNRYSDKVCEEAEDYVE